MESNDLQFDLSELIGAAEMADISQSDTPSDLSP